MEDRSQQSEKENASDRIRALYDSAPYSKVLNAEMQQNTPLLINWINAVCDPEKNALRPDANILVAGCGAGEEVFMLAQLFPTASIVGVDFSPRSIDKANELAQHFPFENFKFAVADLMKTEWIQNYEPFDFVICRGVADYVVDPKQLMKALAECLSLDGVLCLMMNTPFHPAGQVRKAFSDLGVSPNDFIDSDLQRKLLQGVEGVIGNNSNLQGFSNAPKTYLDVDFFPPIAHHDSLETWNERGREVGLFFVGSMDSLIDLLKVSDDLLPMLYSLGKAELSKWFVNLSRRPGMQLLFRKKQRNEPNFDDLEQLWKWNPKLDASLGTLPAMQGNPELPQNLTLRFQGLPDFVINCKTYDIEVLRHCDGQRNLSQIQQMINVEGDLESLRVTLFRAYHYALLA